MLRARIAFAVLVGFTAWLASLAVCEAQTAVNLPSRRNPVMQSLNGVLNDGSGVQIDFNGSPYDSDFDVGSWDADSLSMVFDALVDLTWYGWGYAEAALSANGEISVSPNESANAPEVFVQAIANADATVADLENVPLDAVVYNQVQLASGAPFTLEQNSEHPSVGLETDSARLVGELYTTIIGNIDETGSCLTRINTYLSSFDTNTYVYRESGVGLSPLDPNGDNWSAQGSLSESTESNPDADPITVDDALLSPFSIGWVTTMATNVDAQIFMSATIVDFDRLDVDDDPYSDYPLTSSIGPDRHYIAGVTYQVYGYLP
jgi:hypothetical protein